MTARKCNHSRILFIFSFLVLILPLFQSAAFANGQIVIPEPPMPWPQFHPLILEREEVKTTIDGQVARTHIRQIWRNNNGMMLEGEFLFPLPTGRATMSDFVLWMDGKKLTFETLDAGKARNIYESIVRQMRDPGLLEYAGDGLLKCRVFPIPANGTKEIELEYREVLIKEGTLAKYAFPLGIKGLPQPVGTLLFDIDVTSQSPMGRVYSPTHDIAIDMRDSRHVRATLEKTNYSPTGEFVLFMTYPDNEFGVNLITSKPSGDDGYFLGLISPRFDYDTAKTKPIPKDFLFILDTSGSMEGQKIRQAKEALKYVLQNLNPDDRFGLISFSTDVNKFREKLETTSAVKDAVKYVDGLAAVGGTFIDGALKSGLSFTSGTKDRPFYIVFLTDGLPTIGEQNIDTILGNVQKANERNAKIFAFGVGDDVNIPFIDKLSTENGGIYTNVAPDENIEVPVSTLYQKIKSPMLTDLEIKINGVDVYDVYPKKLPDLFKGGQLVITGRFKGSGDASVKLSGRIGGSSMKTLDYKIRFSPSDNNNFVPPLWANRKVGYLLNQLRLYGQNQEIIDQITSLAKKFGIITPFTSYLVLEDYDIMPAEPMMRSLAAPGAVAMDSAGGGGHGGGGFKQGEAARSASKSLQKQEQAESLDELSKDKEGSSKQQVQQVKNKTFVQKGKYWVDTEYTEDQKLEEVKIEFMSDEYFKLLDKFPEIGEYLSVGDNLQLVWKGQLITITAEEEK